MKTKIEVRLDKELRDQFKQITEDNAHNPSALIRKWIENYIEENKGE